MERGLGSWVADTARHLVGRCSPDKAANIQRVLAGNINSADRKHYKKDRIDQVTAAAINPLLGLDNSFLYTASASQMVVAEATRLIQLDQAQLDDEIRRDAQDRAQHYHLTPH